MPTQNRSSSTKRSSTAARALTVGALCAAFVAAAPVPAYAQTLSDTDTTGDVVMATYTEEDQEVLVPVPDRELNDISSTTLTHNPRRIGIRVEYAELKRVDLQVLDIDMVTNEKVGRHITVLAYRKQWAGRTEFSGRHYRSIECEVKHSIDYEANVMKVSFPRRCASDPRWAQFRVAAFVDSGDEFYADDGLRDRALTAEDKRAAQSDRVYRGEGSS